MTEYINNNKSLYSKSNIQLAYKNFNNNNIDLILYLYLYTKPIREF